MGGGASWMIDDVVFLCAPTLPLQRDSPIAIRANAQ